MTRENSTPETDTRDGEPREGDAAKPEKSAAERFQEDVISGKAFDKRLLGRLLRYSLPYRRAVWLAIALPVVITLLGLAGPFIIRAALDGPLAAAAQDGATATTRDDARSQLWMLTAGFLGVSAILLSLRFAQTLLMAWIGQRVMYDLRLEVFRKLIRLPLSYYDRNPVGRLVTRITSDVEALNELFASGWFAFIADVLVLAGITIALLVVDMTLALVTLGVLPLLLFATFVFRAKARVFYREQRGHLSHLNAFTQESVQGMSLLQAFRRENDNQGHYEEIHDRYRRAFLRSVFSYSVYFPVVEFLATGAVAAVIWQAAHQLAATPPEITLGDFFLFWFFLGKFFQPIRDMAERYNILQSAMAAGERLFKLLDTPSTLRDPDAPRPLERLEGRVAFENVWFAYTDEDWVLRDVSFVVEPGQTVAIVGATGAGKSTIIQLLSRFYDPQRGRITVDGIDVRDVEKAALRSRIAVVLQDVFIFSRTVAENIRLGSSEIGDDDVRAAAERVNVDRFVDRLPKGYDAELKERGRSLSVGERQLLSFARALVHDPDLLVLDEATANVDSATEALIQDALAKLLAGRTSIVIAHRLSTVRRAAKIVVLHKGVVRETGTHSELVARGGIYKRLHELQYR